MTITARNYLYGLRRDLPLLQNELRNRSGFEQDLECLNMFSDLASKAHAFAIPDEAVIFDDGYRGLIGVEARLPFPCIAIEFYCQKPENIRLSDNMEWPSKNLVLAAEINGSDGIHAKIASWAHGPALTEDEHAILIMSASCGKHSSWLPDTSACLLPRQWDTPPNMYDEIARVDAREDMKPTDTSLHPIVFSPFPSVLKAEVDLGGVDRAIGHLTAIRRRNMNSVLELCEAFPAPGVPGR